jgi:isopentenyl-diphosphate delta-isomerase
MNEEENFIKSEEKVILVDKNDKEIGIGEKLQTHKKGELHRAFSVFVFNSKDELLLQKRAKSKYHSGGLWTNTCCSHPKPGELIEKTIHRRLKEEMGFDCNLKQIFNFYYKEKLDNIFFEHEWDYIFFGKFDGEPMPNPEEVDDWKWISLEELKKDMLKNSGNYTAWLKILIDKVIYYFKLGF